LKKGMGGGGQSGLACPRMQSKLTAVRELVFVDEILTEKGGKVVGKTKLKLTEGG